MQPEPGPYGVLMFGGGVLAVVDAADFALAASLCTRVLLSQTLNAYVGVAPARAEAAGHPRVTTLHRVLAPNPVGSGPHVDHINGDGLNNCRWNLRVVTPSVNRRNKFRSATRLVDGLWPSELVGLPCVGVQRVDPRSMRDMVKEPADAAQWRAHRDAEARELERRRLEPWRQPYFAPPRIYGFR